MTTIFIIGFVLVLVALILVHELGHFSVAKFFNIKVDEFGIFFPPRIFAIKKGETEYSLNWLPFGGFVKIFGENYDEGKNDPRSFVSKPRYQQALVIVAGIACNILFAWGLLSVGYMVGMPTVEDDSFYGAQVKNEQVVVGNVFPNSPAEKAGLRQKDVIVKVETGTDSLDPRTLNNDQQAVSVTNFIKAHNKESIIFFVERRGEAKQFLAKADESIEPGNLLVGVLLYDVGILTLPPHEAVVVGGKLTWAYTKGTAVGLLGFFKQIFTAKANFGDVSGPIGITVFGAGALQDGLLSILELAALISINLAVINLLPIPGLDGGRLFIIGIESVIRRPVSPNVVMKFTIAGFAFLILLMVVVSYHDILKLVG